MSCWIVLSIVHWVRRDKLDVILSMKRPKINLRKDYNIDFSHERDKLYDRDRLSIPTKADLER